MTISVMIQYLANKYGYDANHIVYVGAVIELSELRNMIMQILAAKVVDELFERHQRVLQEVVRTNYKKRGIIFLIDTPKKYIDPIHKICGFVVESKIHHDYEPSYYVFVSGNTSGYINGVPILPSKLEAICKYIVNLCPAIVDSNNNHSRRITLKFI